MVETSFDVGAAATRFATLVANTGTTLGQQLPSSRVAPLFSTSAAGAIVDRTGREVRPPVQRKNKAPTGGA